LTLNFHHSFLLFMKLQKNHLHPSENRGKKTAGRIASGRAIAAGLIGIAASLAPVFQAQAQSVTRTRTTKVVAAVSDTSKTVWTINRAGFSGVKVLAGNLTPVGTILGFNSIATDPTTGEHYCIIRRQSAPSVTALATVNLLSGGVTHIADLVDSIVSISFNMNGTLFGTTGENATDPETLVRIDKTTGAFITEGARSAAGDDEVMAYCADNNKLYRWSGNPITWERFDTSGVAPVETLTFAPTPANGVIGAMYDGGGSFLTSVNEPAGSSWHLWDTLGNVGASLATFPHRLRGFVSETHTSSVTSSGALAICPGSGVTFTVTGGTGGYLWYKDGTELTSETNDSYTATSPGVYNVMYADQNGVIDSPSTGFVVSYLETASINVAPSTAVCHGATVANVFYSTTTLFNAGTPIQSMTVPADVTSLHFDISGAAGGADTSAMAAPGLGGRLSGELAVAPGDAVTVYTGSAGNDGSGIGAAGGFNGGGNTTGFGGAGGGATDIRLNGTTLAHRVAVAGGGAGSGYNVTAEMTVPGGNGGDLVAASGGINADGDAASGGTQIAGGTGAMYTGFASGQNGDELLGGDASIDGVSGAGGGGYYGGGGGVWSGGGGGSSFAHATLVTAPIHVAGANAGHGSGSVSYTVPATYSYTITWSGAAISAGFTNVSATAFPSASSFAVTVPTTATPGTYNATLGINNGICTRNYPISIEVKPIPDVNATTDMQACNGATMAGTTFSGSLTGTQFLWNNNKPSIGLAASGNGDIAAFTAINNTTGIDTAHIIVTPELNGCFGIPDTFNMVVFPSPMLSVNPGNVCDNVAISYTPASATTGTSFAWERTTVPTGLTTTAPTASGSGAITETFDNTTTNVIPVVYTFTLTANGCSHIEDLNVNVNPTPVLLPFLTGTICDNSLFSFAPSSSTPGVVHTWSRAAVTGIANAAASGTGNINETLDNTTVNTILVTYVDTLNINGCINTQTIDVNVSPTPVLSSPLTANVCNNSEFDYNATSSSAVSSITWTRAIVPGITSPAASGPDTVNETHSNITENPIVVTYDFTLSINGCSNTQAVALTVNPTATLNTTLTPAAVCDSSIFDYEPNSNTIGATFSWVRAGVTGIGNPPSFGTGNPTERLRDTVLFPVVVVYTFTTTINGCSNSQNVSVTVNPRPILTNSPLSFAVCDSAQISFIPTGIPLGTYTWSRPFVSGILALQLDNQTGPISEYLKNSTNVNRTVQYAIDYTANGCSRVTTVNVTVRPEPKLSSSLTDSACSGVPFIYDAESQVIPVPSLAWSRASVSGITPATGTGSGDINETLINNTASPLSVIYVYTVTVGGACSKAYNLNVLVRPAAAAPVIAVQPSANLCGASLYQTYGAAEPAAAGTSYTWSATNAEVYATGTGNQYALVNFHGAGTAVITLTSSVGATGCIGVAHDTVTVGTDTAVMPRVIYTNGAFICLKNGVKSWQWGYDDAATLDSVILSGETNQSYFNKNPDFASRHYWVMVDDGKCLKKSYYNVPGDNTPRFNGTDEDLSAMNVYPNPTSEVVNVAVNTVSEGMVTVEVSNMLGQSLYRTETDSRRVGINVATLPAGMYMVDCYVAGVKIGTAKFVKN
jgi:hypothetical protein